MKKDSIAIHRDFMFRALSLAEKGRGLTALNPVVGAVVVKNNKIVGAGYHPFFGGPHAEVVALKNAGKKAKGATLYISLEPCSTFGKTPPCTDAIIAHNIRHVVIAVLDPNPLHHGRGVRILRRRGIKVSVGLLRQEAMKQNEAFFMLMKKRRPFIIVKMAQSIDGKIATPSGDSRWITGPKARRQVHSLRSQVDAILVGKRTVLCDDPRLTARSVRKKRQPIRIVIDTNGEIPLNKRIFNTKQGEQAIVVMSQKTFKKKQLLYKEKNIIPLAAALKKGRIDLGSMVKRLVPYGIATLLIEGGGEIAAAFFESKIVDKIYFYTAPIILGGRSAPTSIDGQGVSSVKDAISISNICYTQIGCDVLLEGYPVYGMHNTRRN